MTQPPQTSFATVRKFTDPDWTAKGDRRASVRFQGLETLWFNTGTLCNITCAHCYIESSPTNDRLSYLTPADAEPFLAEARAMAAPLREVGFTGGEPFNNPDMIALAELALGYGLDVQILTNATRPMQRPGMIAGLERLKAEYGQRLKLRVSLDHFDAAHHDNERGEGSFAFAINGLRWLSCSGFSVTVASRQRWGTSDEAMRAGFANLFTAQRIGLDAMSPGQLVIFPEMDETVDVPEITTACWGILHLAPASLMCATSRMVVRRKGCDHPVVLPCTLLPYDERFEMGPSLAAASAADGGMFDQGAVKLNHHHCAKFCVLGGGSCSG